MITKFHLFELANIGSLIDPDKLKNLDLIKKVTQEFQDDVKLTKNINKTKDDNILINIKYNDSDKHPIKQRIKNRTQLRSISDFNKILGEGLLDFFKTTDETMIANTVNAGKYAIRFNEYRFSVIFSIRGINSKEYQGNYATFYNIYIYSILGDVTDKNVIKTHFTGVLL